MWSLCLCFLINVSLNISCLHGYENSSSYRNHKVCPSCTLSSTRNVFPIACSLCFQLTYEKYIPQFPSKDNKYKSFETLFPYPGTGGASIFFDYPWPLPDGFCNRELNDKYMYYPSRSCLLTKGLGGQNPTLHPVPVYVTAMPIPNENNVVNLIYSFYPFQLGGRNRSYRYQLMQIWRSCGGLEVYCHTFNQFETN
jgi:hypothetical protein